MQQFSYVRHGTVRGVAEVVVICPAVLSFHTAWRHAGPALDRRGQQSGAGGLTAAAAGIALARVNKPKAAEQEKLGDEQKDTPSHQRAFVAYIGRSRAKFLVITLKEGYCRLSRNGDPAGNYT